MWRRREDLLNESLSLSYLPAEIGIGFLSPERDAPSVSPSSNFVLCNFCVTSSAPSEARSGSYNMKMIILILLEQEVSSGIPNPILGLHVTSWWPCWWNFNKRMLISFYCTWHQHGRYVFVFWISRDWLQTINNPQSGDYTIISFSMGTSSCPHPQPHPRPHSSDKSQLPWRRGGLW